MGEGYYIFRRELLQDWAEAQEGKKMLYYKNDIMKKRVSGLEARHRRLYRFVSEYYRRWNKPPLVEHMVIEMSASSEDEVFQLLDDLTCAGCLALREDRAIQPMLSPEDAAIWCGDDAQSVNEKMCIIQRVVSVAHYNGAVPDFSEFIEPYRSSALYLLIREQAEPYFIKCISTVENDRIAAEPPGCPVPAGA